MLIHQQSHREHSENLQDAGFSARTLCVLCDSVVKPFRWRRSKKTATPGLESQGRRSYIEAREPAQKSGPTISLPLGVQTLVNVDAETVGATVRALASAMATTMPPLWPV